MLLPPNPQFFSQICCTNLSFWNKKPKRLHLLLNIVLFRFMLLPLVLWRCWLGGRKGIRPVKTEWWAAGVVICLELGADVHMAQLMPQPLTVSCSSKIQIGFTFLVPAYPGCPGKEAAKWLLLLLLLLLDWCCCSVADIIDTARDARITHASFSCLTVQLSRHTIAAYAIWLHLRRKIRFGSACEPGNF